MSKNAPKSKPPETLLPTEKLLRRHKEWYDKSPIKLPEEEEVKIQFRANVYKVIKDQILQPPFKAYLENDSESANIAAKHKQHFADYILTLQQPQYCEFMGRIAMIQLSMLVEMSDWTSKESIKNLKKELYDILVKPGEILRRGFLL